jgi:hypothetical protein
MKPTVDSGKYFSILPHESTTSPLPLPVAFNWCLQELHWFRVEGAEEHLQYSFICYKKNSAADGKNSGKYTSNINIT